jgi:tRNA threonylcarbamoyladenosine biosynthesis protein TsaB
MLILGIESASTQVGAAIGGHEGIIASAHSAKGRRHAEELAPQIDFVRKQAQIEFADLGAIAVDLGPGLFTGMRVGITTGITMATMLGIPMVGVTSLDLLAFPVRYTSKRIVAVLDARRGEVFHASYRQVPGGIQRLTEYAVGTADELAAEVQATGEDSLLVGDGAIRYASEFGKNRVVIAEDGLAYPNAASLVQLAHARALREEFVPPRDIEPFYLRQPDVDTSWMERSGK